MGFLPEPVPLEAALGMRLNEVANHAWDVRVGLDPRPTIDPTAAELLVELFAGPLAFLLGFSGKPDQLDERGPAGGPRRGGRDHRRGRREPARPLTRPRRSRARTEAVVRLLSGRLDARAQPRASGVTGNVTLEDLRKVFPGY